MFIVHLNWTTVIKALCEFDSNCTDLAQFKLPYQGCRDEQNHLFFHKKSLDDSVYLRMYLEERSAFFLFLIISGAEHFDGEKGGLVKQPRHIA